MSLEFKFLQPGDKDFHLYKGVLATVYGADSKRVKQKGSVEREYLLGCLVAVKADVPVARCSLYNNPNHYYNKLRFGAVGNYECVNDMSIVLEFLQKVVSTFKAFRLPFAIGPMDGSIWNNFALQCNNDEPLFYPEKQQQKYYHQHFKAAGFQTIAEYVSHKDTHLAIDNDALDYARGNYEKLGVELRAIDMDNLEIEMKRIGEFCIENQKEDFLYSPITAEQFYEKNIVIESFLNPELMLIVEDAERNIVALSFAYDDPYHSLGKTAVIRMVVRKKDARYKGLGKFLGGMIYRYAIANKYNAIIHAIMKTVNASTLASFEYSGTNTYYKRYALYGLKLED